MPCGLLTRALAIVPDYAEARGNLGFLHLARKDYGRAIGELRRALDADPAHGSARYNLAVALLLVREEEAASRELGTLLETHPENEDARRLHLALTRRTSDGG